MDLPIEKIVDFPTKHGDCPIKNGDFPIKHGDFPMKHGDFPMKHGDFPMKHGGFPMKNGDFPIETWWISHGGFSHFFGGSFRSPSSWIPIRWSPKRSADGPLDLWSWAKFRGQRQLGLLESHGFHSG